MTPDVRAFYDAVGVLLPDRLGANASVRCFTDPAAHKHDDRTASCSVNVETGAWCCFGCGARGGPYDAAVALGCQPREAMVLLRTHGLAGEDSGGRAAETSRCSRAPSPPRAAQDGSRSHGKRRRNTLATSQADVARFRERLAGDAALIAWLSEARGWTSEAILRLGLGYDGERVVLPVRDETGLLVGVMRYAPDPASRNGPKMLADSGSVRELFPSPESVSGDLIWLVEGEPDSVAAASLGVSAVAVPGASGWDSNWAARFAGRDVVLCCDCDPPGRTLAGQASRDLAPVARTVRVLDLTASRDDGFDIGDLVRDFGQEGRAQARRILEAAAAATDPVEPERVASRAAAGVGRGATRLMLLAREGEFASERISDALRVRAEGLEGQPEAVASAPEDVAPFALPLAEFIAVKTETPSVLIGDEHENLLPAAGLLILFAKGGRGKTTLIVDLAFHLASGRDWLGLKVPRPLRVLLIENEGPREPFREKLARKRKHWPHDMPGEIFVYTEDWGALKLGENVEELRRFIEEHAIDVVIGDPLDSLGIKGVGSPEDTREFMELLTLVGLRRDVAFLLLHHPRKGDSDDELDEVSGAWGGRPDSLLKLDKLDGNRAWLSFPKVRWSRQGNRSPLILAFEPETEAFEAVGEEQEEERDYAAEIEQLLGDGSWMTVKGIASRKQAKDEPKAGIGAREQAVREALEGNTERFETRSGEAAKMLGRHPNSHLWGVLPGSGAHGSTQLSLRPASASASAPAPIGEQTQGADVDGVIPEAGADDG